MRGSVPDRDGMGWKQDGDKDLLLATVILFLLTMPSLAPFLNASKLSGGLSK
jgi:hypothetical protein